MAPTLTPTSAYLMDAHGTITPATLVDTSAPIELSTDNEWAKALAQRVGTISFKIRPLTRRLRIKLLQIGGRLKAPKLTYKTIKQHCAKRNR